MPVIDSGTVDYLAGQDSTAFVLPMPAGAQAGDVLVVVAVATTSGYTLTPPAGATELVAPVGTPAAYSVTDGVYAYPVGESPPASVTFTWSSPAQGSLVWTLLRGYTVAGAAAAVSTYAVTATATAPSVTAAAGAWILGGANGGFGSLSVSNPPGWVTLADGTRRKGHLASKGAQSAAGATGTAAFGVGTGNDQALRAWQVALPAVDTPQPPDDTVPGTDTSGLLNLPGIMTKPGAHVSWFDGTSWAAVLPTASGHALYRDLRSPAAGTIIDSRQDARAYAVHADGWLGVLRGHATASLFSSFDTADYSALVTDAAVPLLPANSDRSPISVVRSGNGYLWAAALIAGDVLVTRSTDSGATWGAAQTVRSNGTMDGIAALAVTGTTVVLAVNQNDSGDTQPRAWSIGQDSAGYDAASWTSETVPALDAGCTSDDHLAMVTGPDGRVFAVGKTTNNDATAQLLFLLVRSTAGAWAISTIETDPDNAGAGYSRPSVTIVGGSLLVMYGQFNGNQSLYRRVSALTDPTVFGPRLTYAAGPDFENGALLPTPADIAAAGDYPVLAQKVDAQVITLQWPALSTVTYKVVGAPTADGFTIAAKTDGGATKVEAIVGATVGTAGVPDGSGWCQSTLTGLAAGSHSYDLQLTEPDGTVHTVTGGTGHTVPAGSFTFAFGSCHDASLTAPGVDAFQRVASRGPDLFLHLGDFDYDDNLSTDQASQLASLEAAVDSSAGLRDLLANATTVYLKSDHDSGANDTFPGAWTGPNMAAARQMFPYLATPSDGLYQTFSNGRVRFIFTDSRSYMQSDGSTKLGATQLAWLKDQLSQPEQLKLLVMDSCWIDDRTNAGPDSWEAFTAERTDIGDYIAAQAVGQVVILHGDQHAIAATDGSHNPWGGCPVVCGAPFLNYTSIKTGSTSDWSGGFWPWPVDTIQQQYQWADVTDSGSGPITVTFTGYDTSDTARTSLTVVADSPASGSAAGTLTWSGQASGSAQHSAATVGSADWTGQASGSRASTGSTADGIAWAGTASGHAPDVDEASGSAAGALAWSGTAHGSSHDTGTAQGGISWHGEAHGRAPTVGGQSGYATGRVVWAGAADGARTSEGSAAGDYLLAGQAHGTAAHSGSAAHALAWTGAAAGTTPPIGDATGRALGTLRWVGATAGRARRSGSAGGPLVWAIDVAGNRRNLQLTYRVGVDRWAATVTKES